MPDDLLARTKPILAARRMTLRALVIDAVERAIEAPVPAFRLRDASAGGVEAGKVVTSDEINRAVDSMRESPFPG